MGFELYPPADEAVGIWRQLLAAADDDFPIRPVGLGARDSLRLEMGYPLYGHEHSLDTTPLDIGYESKLDFEKGDFFGRDRLLELRQAGAKQCLVGFTVQERGIPRAGAIVRRGEQEAGRVTSGGFAPSLGHSIAMALVCGTRDGEEFFLEVRGKRLGAELAERPFYRQGSVRG
jgi:aminomethyltransferase